MDTIFSCPVCDSVYDLPDMIPMPSCDHVVYRRAEFENYWDIPGSIWEFLTDEGDLLPPIDVSQLDTESEIDEIIALSYEDNPDKCGCMQDLLDVVADDRDFQIRDETDLDDVENDDDDIDLEAWAQTQSDTEEFFHQDAAEIRATVLAVFDRVTELAASRRKNEQ